jgi:hypothetical protein
LTVTAKSVPLGIGAAGVITSLVSPHGRFCAAAALDVGGQAGGFGLSALMGVVSPVRCASGSGSSWPSGSPGYVGWTNLNVAGRPSTVTD